jgi:hypothetical protein
MTQHVVMTAERMTQHVVMTLRDDGEADDSYADYQNPNVKPN